MLNYNQSLPEKKLFQDLQISEITPIMKLIIRGKKREFFSAIGKSLNILLPVESNTSTQSQKLSALWLSPDEWMIFSNETSDKNSNYNETASATICNGDTYTLGDGTPVSVAGNYTVNLVSSQGCDSTVVLTLNVVNAFATNVSAEICEGENYTLPDGSIVNVGGNYPITLVSSIGLSLIHISEPTRR